MMMTCDKTLNTKINVILITVIIAIIILSMSDISTMARKSRGRSRGKMRQQNLPRIVPGSKRTGFFNNTDAAYIVKASHFDVEYSLGHKITLICLAKGNPLPRITWMKELVEIVPHPFLKITEWRIEESEIKSKFEIDPARQMDAGAYSCQANNKYAVDQKHFKVDPLI